MRKLGVLVGIICIMSLVAVGCTPTGTSTDEKAKQARIGLAVPLTGAAATSGSAMTEGTMIWLKYVNDELGGVEYLDPVSGETEKIRLDVLVGDSQYSAARTVAVYKQQQGAGVIAMIIAGNTTLESVASMAIRDRVALVAQGGGFSKGLLEREPMYWTMAAAETATYSVPAMQFIRDIWGETRNPRLAIMIAETPASRAAFTDEVQEQLLPRYSAEIGVDIIGVEWYPFTTTDTTLELTRLRADEPDWIYISGGAVNSVSVIVKDVARLGLSDKVNVLSWWGGSDESILTIAPEESEGLYGQVWVSLPDEDLPGMTLAHRLMQKYYEHDVTTNNLVGLLSGMGLVEGLRIAMEEVGYDNLDGEALNNGLHSIKDFDTGGIWPLITVDPDYPALTNVQKHFVIEGGKFEPVQDWYQAPSFIRELKGLE